MKKNFDYDLTQIESRVKDKYEETMKWIKGLRTPAAKENAELRKIYEQKLGAELCTSVSSTDNLVDATNELGPVYNYKDGECYFDYKGVRFTVADLRGMRSGKFFDICVVLVDRHTDDIWQYDLLPVYCYGSTTDEFERFKPVHDFVIEAADEYVKKNPGAIKDRQDYIKEFESEDDE